MQHNLMEPVRALTFDMYGTLLDLPATFCGAFAAFLSEKGHGASAEHLQAMWEREYLMESMVDTLIGGGRTPFEQVRRATLHQLLSRYGVEHTPDDIEKVLGRATPTLYPDVIDGMNKLSERYTLAILSNGDLSALERVVEGLGIPAHRTLSAEQAGCYKPAPRVYRYGAKALGLEPGQIMHVAAHPWDLRGAEAVGMRTAYIKRESVPYGVGEPDLETATLAEFAGLAARSPSHA